MGKLASPAALAELQPGPRHAGNGRAEARSNDDAASKFTMHQWCLRVHPLEAGRASESVTRWGVTVTGEMIVLHVPHISLALEH